MNERNVKRLKELLEEAMGDRSIRKYAKGAGVDPSTLTRIMQGKHNPSAKILRKLTSTEANPYKGVTFADLMVAAGYEVEDRMDIASSSELEEYSADNEAAQKRRLERVQHALADKQLKALFTGVLYNNLADRGIIFSQININDLNLRRFRPDIAIRVTEQKINSWLFVVRKGHGVGTRSFIGEVVMGRIVLLEENPQRKVSIVVDEPEVFDSVVEFKEKNSYRGNLSVILVDTENVNVVKETDIAFYDPADTDSIPRLID